MTFKTILMSASALGSVAVPSTAQAALLEFTVDWSATSGFGGEDYAGPQSFVIDTEAGFVGGLPGYLYFTTTNDSLGRDTVFFGSSARSGQAGGGNISPALTVPVGNRDFFTPLYSGSGTTLNVAAGDSFTGRFGSVVSVAAAVPEPGTWAMMLLGFGAIGFGMRRRKENGTSQRVRLTYT